MYMYNPFKLSCVYCATECFLVYIFAIATLVSQNQFMREPLMAISLLDEFSMR